MLSEQEMLEMENEKRNVQMEIRSVFDCIEDNIKALVIQTIASLPQAIAGKRQCFQVREIMVI